MLGEYIPTSVFPARVTTSTAGWEARRPGVEPVTTFITPAGSPAWAQMSANSKEDSRVWEDGITTTVFPAARAGATRCAN